MNTVKSISVVLLVSTGYPSLQTISQNLNLENAKLKTLLKQIVRADFADFIERRSTEDENTD